MVANPSGQKSSAIYSRSLTDVTLEPNMLFCLSCSVNSHRRRKSVLREKKL